MKKQDLLKTLNFRINALIEIRDSNYPKARKLKESHEIKVSIAKEYLSEISSLPSSIECIDDNIEFYVVTEETLNSKVERADFSCVEDEGCYYKLALIKNFPYKDIYLLYLAPLSVL